MIESKHSDMCDLTNFSFNNNGSVFAVFLNVTDSANVWTDFYTGPNAFSMTIVFGVIIALWIGSFLLNFILKKRYSYKLTQSVADDSD